jgi:Na+/alanine symporter
MHYQSQAHSTPITTCAAAQSAMTQGIKRGHAHTHAHVGSAQHTDDTQKTTTPRLSGWLRVNGTRELHRCACTSSLKTNKNAARC